MMVCSRQAMYKILSLCFNDVYHVYVAKFPEISPIPCFFKILNAKSLDVRPSIISQLVRVTETLNKSSS